jgi:hypothetical protein
MTSLLERFARYQGRKVFRPVHIGYNNMEEILNITSFGNMNRQFLSLLRSEQESHAPVTGDHRVWEALLGPEAKLTTLDEAFLKRYKEQESAGKAPRRFPYWNTLVLVLTHPRVIWPGIKLSIEILRSYFFGPQKLPPWKNYFVPPPKKEQKYGGAVKKLDNTKDFMTNNENISISPIEQISKNLNDSMTQGRLF